jgi:hypothetical protein
MDDSMDGSGMMRTIFELKTNPGPSGGTGDIIIDLVFAKNVIADDFEARCHSEQEQTSLLRF